MAHSELQRVLHDAGAPAASLLSSATGTTEDRVMPGLSAQKAGFKSATCCCFKWGKDCANPTRRGLGRSWKPQAQGCREQLGTQMAS